MEQRRTVSIHKNETLSYTIALMLSQPDSSAHHTETCTCTRPSPSPFFVTQMTTILRHGVISGFTLIVTKQNKDTMNAVSKGMTMKAVDVFVI